MWIRLVRPTQWTKNAVVLAGLVFGRQADEPAAVWYTVLAIVSFCLASSAGYIFNDVMDRDRDRLHPEKRQRPIARGDIRVVQAAGIGIALMVSALLVALNVSGWLLIVVAAYLLISLAYTAILKRIVVLDVVTIGIGFVLRAVAGAVAAGIPPSPWLLGCAFLLSIFVGFCKRKNELVVLQCEAGNHRSTLRGYRGSLVNILIVVSATMTVLTYLMYTLTSVDVPANHSMTLTVPFVVIAIARYLYLVLGLHLGGSPETMLFRDRVLLGTIGMWSITVMLVMASG